MLQVCKSVRRGSAPVLCRFLGFSSWTPLAMLLVKSWWQQTADSLTGKQSWRLLDEFFWPLITDKAYCKHLPLCMQLMGFDLIEFACLAQTWRVIDQGWFWQSASAWFLTCWPCHCGGWHHVPCSILLNDPHTEWTKRVALPAPSNHKARITWSSWSWPF